MLKLDIHKQKNKSRHLILFTKFMNSWTADLNVKWKTIKLLEDNIVENLDDHMYSDDFLYITPNSWSQKEIINKLDFIKIKNFCSAKDTVKRMRKQVRDWEKIFTKDTIDIRLWSKI